MVLVRRAIEGEGKSLLGSGPYGLVRILSVSATRRGFLTGSGAADGRDQRADCIRRHERPGLVQICEAVRQSGERVRRRWAIRRVVAGREVSPGLD